MMPLTEGLIMLTRPRRLLVWLARDTWQHAARTALAAGGSLAVARFLGLPEAYWAPITAIVVTQSTLMASWMISRQRLIGTALGAILGALCSRPLAQGALAFTAVIVLIGVICGRLGLDQKAYRFAGITYAIIVLMSRSQAAWVVGLHRFVEVSLGITISLVVSVLWQEDQHRQRQG